MGLLVVLVLVSLTMVNTDAPPQDNLTTLDGLFCQRYQQHLQEYSLQELRNFISDVYYFTTDFINWNQASQFDVFTREILDYTKKLVITVALELTWDLGNVTAQAVLDDLNGHCYEYLDKQIEDLNVELKNITCVVTRLTEMVRVKAEKAIKVALEKVSRDCDQQQLELCSAVERKCTRTYEERVGQLLAGFVLDGNVLKPLSETDPVDILAAQVSTNTDLLQHMFNPIRTVFYYASDFIRQPHVMKPFGFDNILRSLTNKDILESINDEEKPTSQDDLTWGIVRSHTGTLKGICSHFRTYSLDSFEYSDYLKFCYELTMLQSNYELWRCGFKESTAETLTWSTARSIYLHSQCLCVASNGHDCGVEENNGDYYLYYCLFVLLRDFQKQVAFRPAVTYLDYAYQARVPICIFSDFLTSSFTSICPITEIFGVDFELAQSASCYFNTLVNKDLNCSESLTVDPHNHTMLCGAMYFVHFVVCEEAADDDVHVSYYVSGDSVLVLFLTYGDVAVRLLTMVSYLACPQLRNLPGKLLICYLMTGLLRHLVVQATLADMTLAVRLDVAMDLSSVFWLTSYLHFLTVSITELRPPNSLSRDEARMLLFSYSLLGWVLPAALSPIFFWINEAVESRVQIGQLLFVLCYFVALLANLYMFFINCSFYFDVRNNVRGLLPGVTARRVFSDLLNFALKTSVLSGAGISLRLIFTQIQGLAGLLGYYHAAGTLQGLILFLLYGCNSEARVFWLSVFRSTYNRCIQRRHNNSVRRTSLEMAQIPAKESHPNTSSS